MPAIPIIGIALGATGAIAAAGSAIAATLGFATVSAVTATAIGSAAFAGASTLATGGSASQALRNAVVGGVSGFAGNYVGNYIGSAVGNATGSTVAANVAASAASAGVRAGVTGQDIGSAILGGAVGAGINAAVGEFGLPPPIQDAASSALRAAYSGRDIPQAVFGSFAGYAAKELGKEFEAQFNSTYNDLANNFQQQTDAVDSYNNLVSEFKDWDAGYQTRLAEFNHIRDLHDAAEAGVWASGEDGDYRRQVLTENADGELVPAYTSGDDGERQPVYVQNPYEAQYQEALENTNDYVSRYNAAWAEKSPMLDELKADITTLQTEGEELSKQYDALHTDAVSTFEDLAVKFKDEQDAASEPTPTPKPTSEPTPAPEPIPVETPPVVDSAPIEEPVPLPAEPTPPPVEEPTLPPVEEPAPLPEEPIQEQPVSESVPAEEPEPLLEEPPTRGYAPAQEAPAQELPPEEPALILEEPPADEYPVSDAADQDDADAGAVLELAPTEDPGWVSGEELPTGDYNQPTDWYAADQDDADMGASMLGDDWYAADQDDFDMRPSSFGLPFKSRAPSLNFRPAAKRPASRGSQESQRLKQITQDSRRNVDELFGSLGYPRESRPYFPEENSAGSSYSQLMNAYPGQSYASPAPSTSGLGAMYQPQQMATAFRPPAEPFQQVGGLGGGRMASQFMPQVMADAAQMSPLRIASLEQEMPLTGRPAMAPSRLDLSQLRPTAQLFEPEETNTFSGGPLERIAGLTALLSGRG